MSLGKTLYSLLSFVVQPRKTGPCMTKNVDWDIDTVLK